MAGYAKRAFDNYISKKKSLFYQIIKNEILPILPENYDFSTIYSILKSYYPFELRAFQFQLNMYAHQDKTLKHFKHKHRYNVKSIENYLNSTPITNLFNANIKSEHKNNFNPEKQKLLEQKFIDARTKQNAKKFVKISIAKSRAQSVEPIFLDKLIGIYSRKGRTQKDRVYIIHELYKYDCEKITNFFSKLLVSEQNFQIRQMVLKHLQDYCYLPQLRGKDSIPIHTKNKKKREKIKKYRDLKYSIEGIPDELFYQIQNSNVQKIKKFDFFISHSYKDYNAVQKLISMLNKKNLNIYCDWISDADYLKRELVCETTLKIIEQRILESNEIIYVDSEFSRTSHWVAYELQYAKKNNKNIKSISIESCNESKLNIINLQDEWFLNKNINNLV